MGILDLKSESEIKKKFFFFLKDHFKAKILLDKKIPGLALSPDFFIERPLKKRMVFWQNRPLYPEANEEEIDRSIKRGYGVYLAVYYDESEEQEELLEDLIEKCEKIGVGIIKAEKESFKRILYSNVDYPPSDKIVEGRTKIFISSRLWIEERDICRRIIQKHKHQQICIERIPDIEGELMRECLKWVKKSEFFVGIIIKNYREVVDKEIRCALKNKKPGRILIYIDSHFSGKNLKKKKIRKQKDLIDKVKKHKRFYIFGTAKDFSRDLSSRLPNLVNKFIKIK